MGYRKLCTEFYNNSKPRAGNKEVTFYENFLKQGTGPFLEAMCGSGRLLIPLLEKGFVIDGVDNSPEMLESCSERCRQLNVKTNLFNQSLQNLSLPHKYGLIFIAIGSFQLIEDRSHVFAVLHNLYNHLLPGGSLLLETFIPWDAIKDCIHGDRVHSTSTMYFEKKEILPDSSEIINKGKVTTYPAEQLGISESRYTKVLNKNIIETEDERLAVRWYHRYEMELLLQKIGFTRIQLWDESFELNPQATVYQAIK